MDAFEIKDTAIPEVKIIQPQVFADERGYFFESYSGRKYEIQGEVFDFCQDNESKSRRGILRGLHYQLPPHAQTKLVRVVQGEVLDVAVDIRRGSPTFGKHVAVLLSGENKSQLLIPKGFAHGFAVLSEEAIFAYKVDAYYAPESDRGIRFDDPDLGIDWRLDPAEVLLSGKDGQLPSFREAELFTYGEEK